MKTQHKQNIVNTGLSIPLFALGLLGTGAADAGRIARGDFNGDGRDDMMVGIPNENVGTIKNAGAVSVFHGTASGLYAEPVHQIHQNSPGSSTRAAIKDTAE